MTQRPSSRPFPSRDPPLGQAARPGRARPDRRGTGPDPDHRRANARPWQARPLALRHRRRGAARRWPSCSRARLPEHDPGAPRAHYAKALEFAHQAPALVVLVSAPVPITRSRCGSRNCRAARRHEPAACRPCAGLCRRLDHRLGGLFRTTSAPPSAAKASGSPASSSSARRPPARGTAAPDR